MQRPSRGFTLIEVLVAVFIFAIITGMSYRVLTTILDSRERVERETQRWRDIGLAFSRIEQDVNAILNRPARDPGGLVQPPFVGVQVPRGDEGQMMVTRMGALDLPGPLGAPQRVGWRLREGILEQLIWPVLDAGPRTRPLAAPVLAGVASFTLRYLDQGGSWQLLWPARSTGVTPVTGSEVPVAIEVIMVLASGERIDRLFVTNLGGR